MFRPDHTGLCAFKERFLIGSKIFEEVPNEDTAWYLKSMQPQWKSYNTGNFL